MPERDHRKSVELTQTINEQKLNYPLARATGSIQSISALNNAGRWKPGVFRCNAVVISKATGTSAGTSCSGTYLANKCSMSGHIHAYLANAAKYTPAGVNLLTMPAWDGTAAAHSLQKAYANTNAADVDVGVMLGELSETIAGLINPFSSIRKYIQIYNRLRRRGRRPGMTATLNMLSGSWLEWWYGIFPVIRDIQTIIQHVKAQTRAIDGKLERSGGRVHLPQQYRRIPVSVGPGVFYVEGTVNVTITTFYASKVYFRRNRPLTFAEQYGLDLASMPSIAWELMPLSFVWDWFFGVGAWLKSCQTSDARTMLGSCTSQKSTIEASVSVHKVLLYYTKSVPLGGGGYHSSCSKLDRRVNQAVAMSPLINRTALGIKHQVDALSLIWQKLPKLRR